MPSLTGVWTWMIPNENDHPTMNNAMKVQTKFSTFLRAEHEPEMNGDG